jgi:hypothetical protein
VPSQLAWARLGDIRTLARLRGWQDGAPATKRDFALFLSACFLAQALVVPSMKEEILALAAEFTPTWSPQQVQSCVSSVVARAQAAARGEKVRFGDVEVSPLYRWRNSTLIDRLEITPAEEIQLTTIIGRDEARRRDAQRKRILRSEAVASGKAQSRAQWLQTHSDKGGQARAMRAQGESWAVIAKKLGFASADAARMGSK